MQPISSILFFLLISFWSLGIFADEISEVNLPEITKEGTAGSILLEDPVVPVQKGQVGQSSGAGSIQNSLQNQLAIPVADSGRPGNRAQLRGLGPSTEDVDVQVFGISLSPAQGGGFDFSAYPQFLWSDFQYQSGPSLNALNQSAATGTVALNPWTAKAIDDSAASGFKIRGRGFTSSLGVGQFSAAAQQGQDAAVVAGYSSFKAVGPSGGFSGRWKSGKYIGKVHLLATDLDAESSGSLTFSTPQARMRTQRWIPVIQNDFLIGSEGVLRTNLFFDSLNMDYRDPKSAFTSSDTVRQWGFETVYKTADWKVGVSARQVEYEMTSSFQSFQAPRQSIGNIQLSRQIDLSDVLLEPTFQGVWVNGYGFLPQGSIGLRKEWDRNKQAVFARATFSRRMPSLLDRYYVFTTFVGNPDLKTELNWTGVLGAEYKSKSLEASLQSYMQLRQNARVLQGNSVTNLQDAYILAASGKVSAYLASTLDWISSITFSDSRILATGFSFPYVSPWIGTSGLSVHSKLNPKKWEWVTHFRFEGSRVYDPSSGDRLSAYGVVDTGISVFLTDSIQLGGRCENLLDREIELIKGYPLGRSFSLVLSGGV